MRTAPALRPLLLAVLASALGACSVPTTVSPDPDEASISREALDAARARWDAAGVDDYRFVYEESCFCPPEFRGPYAITVEDGAVASVLYEGAPATVDRSFPTIDTLFARLGEAFDRDAETIRATFDPEYGLPVDAYIDYEAMVADEELGFTVSDFALTGSVR